MSDKCKHCDSVELALIASRQQIADPRERLRASEAEVARLRQKTTELAAMHSELLRDNSELSDKVTSQADDLGRLRREVEDRRREVLELLSQKDGKAAF